MTGTARDPDALTAELIAVLENPDVDAARVRQVVRALAGDAESPQLAGRLRAAIAGMPVSLRQVAFGELRALLGPSRRAVVDIAEDLLGDPNLKLGRTNESDAARSVLQGGRPSAAVLRRLLLIDDAAVQDEARRQAAGLLRSSSTDDGIEAMFDDLRSSEDPLETDAYIDVVARAREMGLAEEETSNGEGPPAASPGSAASVVGRTTSEGIQLHSIQIVRKLALQLEDTTDDPAEKIVAGSILSSLDVLEAHVTGERTLPEKSLEALLESLKAHGDILMRIYAVGSALHDLGSTILQALFGG